MGWRCASWALGAGRISQRQLKKVPVVGWWARDGTCPGLLRSFERAVPQFLSRSSALTRSVRDTGPKSCALPGVLASLAVRHAQPAVFSINFLLLPLAFLLVLASRHVLFSARLR
jgi:hypothetical protein